MATRALDGLNRAPCARCCLHLHACRKHDVALSQLVPDQSHKMEMFFAFCCISFWRLSWISKRMIPQLQPFLVRKIASHEDVEKLVKELGSA